MELQAASAPGHEFSSVPVAVSEARGPGRGVFAQSAVSALEAKVQAHFAQHRELTTQAFKELTGVSRKFLIPLAEYFARQKVTLRVADRRLLRRKNES